MSLYWIRSNASVGGFKLEISCVTAEVPLVEASSKKIQFVRVQGPSPKKSIAPGDMPAAGGGIRPLSLVETKPLTLLREKLQLVTFKLTLELPVTSMAPPS